MGGELDLLFHQHKHIAERFAVSALMAWLTESNPILQTQPKIWMIRKRLDVMGFQVPAPRVAAVLARKLVPSIDREPPSLIVGRSALIQVACLAPVLPGIVRWSARNRLPFLLCGPDLRNCFGCVRLPEAIGVPASSITHRLLCSIGMRPPFERRGRWWLLGIGDAPAIEATAVAAIGPAAVVAEGIPGLPHLASRATAETASNSRLVVL